MIYEVSPMSNINFGATGVEEVLQNVAFILSTFEMSCPLDRAFGWTPPLDEPIQVAKAKTGTRLVQAIHEFEPRAVVTEVIFKGNPLEGLLKTRVKVSINE